MNTKKGNIKTSLKAELAIRIEAAQVASENAGNKYPIMCNDEYAALINLGVWVAYHHLYLTPCPQEARSTCASFIEKITGMADELLELGKKVSAHHQVYLSVVETD